MVARAAPDATVKEVAMGAGVRCSRGATVENAPLVRTVVFPNAPVFDAELLDSVINEAATVGVHAQGDCRRELLDGALVSSI